VAEEILGGARRNSLYPIKVQNMKVGLLY